MDRESVLRQIERLEAVRVEKAGQLMKAATGAGRGARKVGDLKRLRSEIQHADDQIATMRNALSALARIGEGTTRYYVSKRHAAGR